MADVRATTFRSGNGYSCLAAACSVSCTWRAGSSVSPPCQRASAAARWHFRRCRAAHGEPAEQDSDSGGGMSDGAEGDPEVKPL